MYKDMEKCRRVLTRELSKRAACREYRIEWRTLERILMHEVAAGFDSHPHRRDLGDAIAAYVTHDPSGRFRSELARKVLLSKSALARAGFSTGGRARYGFRRHLMRDDGTPVRQLVDGERIKMAGHHVAWLPGPEDEQAVSASILDMLHSMPATRVAATLTANGVPTPDAGRTRVDGGVRHLTRGIWNATTVTNIARNALLIGEVVFNRRGMGDQLRLGPDGIRELTDSDYRGDGQPKVVINPAEAHITSKAHFEPLIDKADHDELMAILDARGASQRGKPRSRDPGRNPLGARVFDLNCSWPMYRVPRKDSFQYTCSQYGQSDGQICDHNHVDGMAATKFVLSCIQQRVSGLGNRLEERLRAIAKKEFAQQGDRTDTTRVQNDLAQVKADLVRAGQNLARADGDDQYRAVAAEFDRLKLREKSLVTELAESNAQPVSHLDLESEVEMAMGGLARMADLATDEANLPRITELFRQANVRLFLRFEKKQPKKRQINVLTSGVLAIGSAPSPIEVYQGPTARNRVRDASAPAGSGLASAEIVLGSGSEGNSLGNVNRGDMI